ncbi:hypothetical protein PVMG_00741 [Plasmodium vivax Mauritania I]|uniref:Uncharacterized protein n=1 Tax=Plasmodium vivax Mauritania I TaxID=1035515 RepID=A0A0J9TCS5_PLAVI|nr:hypothetical protein PVMG_00741 [Plasmodium vivax Mauritania I]
MKQCMKKETVREKRVSTLAMPWRLGVTTTTKIMKSCQEQWQITPVIMACTVSMYPIFHRTKGVRILGTQEKTTAVTTCSRVSQHKTSMCTTALRAHGNNLKVKTHSSRARCTRRGTTIFFILLIL